MVDPYVPPLAEEVPLPTTDHSLYPLVLRMVLWGEAKERIFHRMAMNGLSGPAAEHLHQLAVAERVRTIRGDCVAKMRVGAGTVGASVAIFLFCWFGVGMIPRVLMLLCLLGVGVGGWRLIDGFSGYLMAAQKEGPLDAD